MPSTEELDRSLLHLRLESFISARWGLTASVRPRAQLSYLCQAAGDVARPTLDDLFLTVTGRSLREDAAPAA